MKQEAVFELAGQRVDALCVALGAKRGDDQCLRLAAREQRRAVRARQQAVADFDRAHGARVAAVDARFAGQDLATHERCLDVEQHAFDFGRIDLGAAFFQRLHDFRISRARGLRAALLVANFIGRAQLVFGQRLDLLDHRFVPGRCGPVPDRLAGVAHEFMNRLDRDPALLVAEHDRAEHDFFRQLLRFGFDHQHRGFRARHHQIHQRLLARGLARVQHIFAIDVADPCGAQRPVERDARDRQRGAHADHCGDVGIDFRVQRNGVDHHMHFVNEAFRKQRTDRPVDQAAGQCFQLARLGFAFEKAAGDAAGRIRLLDVVDCQREEILPRLRRLRGDHGGQHHGVVDVDQHGSTGLAGDFARFQHDGLVAPLKGFADFIEKAHGLHSILHR